MTQKSRFEILSESFSETMNDLKQDALMAGTSITYITSQAFEETFAPKRGDIDEQGIFHPDRRSLGTLPEAVADLWSWLPHSRGVIEGTVKAGASVFDKAKQKSMEIQREKVDFDRIAQLEEADLNDLLGGLHGDRDALTNFTRASEKFRFLMINGLASFVPMLATSPIKGGALATSFILNASSNYDELKDKFSDDEAMMRAVIGAMPQSLLDVAVPKQLEKRIGTKTIRGVMLTALKEGNFESFQEVISMALGVEFSGDEGLKEAFAKAFEGGWKRVKESFFTGVGVAGTTATTFGAVDLALSKDRSPKIPEYTKRIKEKADEILELNKKVAKDVNDNIDRIEHLDELKEIPSDPELFALPDQEITSSETSINNKKLPSVFNKLKDVVKKGTSNFDIGGGKFDNATEFLKGLGVTNRVFDPFNRSKDHNEKVIQEGANGQSDTATISNVLNVIKEEENQLKVIRQAHNALKEGGSVYITVYEGDRSGTGKETKKGYQQNKKLADYMSLVEKVFGSDFVERKKGMIVATKTFDGDSRTKTAEEIENERLTLVQSQYKAYLEDLRQLKESGAPVDSDERRRKGFNLSKLDISKDAKILLEAGVNEYERTGTIDPEVQRIIPMKEMKGKSTAEVLKILRKANKDTDGTFNELIKEVRKAEVQTKKLPFILSAWRAFQGAVADGLVPLADRVIDGTATEEETIKFVYIRGFLSEFLPSVKGVQTNVARTLTSLRNTLDSSSISLDPDKLAVEQMQKDQISLDKVKNMFKVLVGKDGAKQLAMEFKEQMSAERKRLHRKRGETQPFFAWLVAFNQATALMNPIRRYVELVGSALQLGRQFVEDQMIYHGVAGFFGDIRGVFSQQRQVLRGAYESPISDIEYGYIMEGYTMFWTEFVSAIKEAPNAFKAMKAKDDLGMYRGMSGLQDFLEARSRIRSLREIEGTERVPRPSSRESLSSSDNPFSFGVKKLSRPMQEMGQRIFPRLKKKSVSDYNVEDLMWWGVEQSLTGYQTLGYLVPSILDPIAENIAYNLSTRRRVARLAHQLEQKGVLDVPIEEFIGTLLFQIDELHNGSDTSKWSPFTRNMVNNILSESTVDAERITFKEPLQGGASTNLAGAFDQMLSRNPVMKLLLGVLFNRTANNFYREAGRMTPLISRMSKKWSEDIKGVNGRVEQDRASARIAIGAGLFMLFTAFREDDRVFSAYKKRMRKMQRTLGVPENSLDIPFDEEETFYSFMATEPFATIGQATNAFWDIVEAGDLLKKGDISEEQLRDTVVISIGNVFVNKTFMRPVNDMFKTVIGETKPETYLARRSELFVPFSSITKMFKENQAFASSDPFMKETLTIMDSIKRSLPDPALEIIDKVPYLDEFGFDVERRTLLDVYGREVRHQEQRNDFDFVADLLQIPRGRVLDDPVTQELLRLGINVRDMNRRMLVPTTDVRLKLEPDEYHELRKYLNTIDPSEIEDSGFLTMYEELLSVIESDDYIRTYNTVDRREVLLEVITAHKQRARDLLIENNHKVGAKVDLIVSAYDEFLMEESRIPEKDKKRLFRPFKKEVIPANE